METNKSGTENTPPAKNSGRDRGWYKAPNLMADKWARILGPQPFLVYQIMKSMCISDSTITSPQASQQDWAEWCGLGVLVFKRALKELVSLGLVDKISPGNPAHAMLYEVRDLDNIPIPKILPKKVKPLSKGNRFHDPLFELELWKQNMYREAETPRIKRQIQDRLNSAPYTRSIATDTARSIATDTTIVRLKNSKTEKILPKGSIKGSDEPSQFLNDCSSPDGWKIISQSTVEIEFPHEQTKTSPMTERIQKNLSPKPTDASRQKAKEQIPPPEQMPRPMRVWFDLPLVSKPKTLRVYKRNLAHLSKLSKGQFPTDYKHLNADWTHQKGQPEISRKYLDRSWTDEDIAHLLDTKFRRILTDIAYWPQNKEKYFKGLSFESFVFNSYSGRSWLLDLEYRQPQLEKSIDTKRTLEQDPHPECTHEIAEALEISQKINPEAYAGIARNFSRIVQFFQSLPSNEELGGIFKFVNRPQTIAYSFAEFLRQEYGWVKDPGAGLIKLNGKAFRRWLEEWNDQEIALPGRKKPSCIWDLLDEYNQYGKLRVLSSPVMEEVLPQKQIEKEEAAPVWSEAELRERQEDAEKYLAPEDIVYAEGEKPEKGRMWTKIKAALQRLKQGLPDPVVDESYAGF